MATEWSVDAACRDMDPDAFFVPRGSRTMATEAKAICQGCPIRERCLERGLDEPEGIWGGTTPRERREINRMRRQAA